MRPVAVQVWLHDGGAELAAAGRGRDVAETFRARMFGRFGVPGGDDADPVGGDHHEVVDDGGDDQEVEGDVDEVAVAEVTFVDGEDQVGEVRLPAQRGDQRCDQVLDQRLHDVAERHADHDRDREVDEVASHEELPEAGHSPTISCAGRGGRKVPPARRDQAVTIPACDHTGGGACAA